jgi:hypothetical protein
LFPEAACYNQNIKRVFSIHHMSITQIKSKERIKNIGEVFTHAREIYAMLDLLSDDFVHVDATFLEPACGNGNFLCEILKRKLNLVAEKFSKTQSEYEMNAFKAVTSIYGIDIQHDNIKECVERLFELMSAHYKSKYKETCKAEFLKSIIFVLTKNIIQGDTTSYKTKSNQSILFTEWNVITSECVVRKEYKFDDLIHHASAREFPLFKDKVDDLDNSYNRRANQQFKPVHFLSLHEAKLDETQFYKVESAIYQNDSKFAIDHSLRFDVIIGNPPYQTLDGGHSASAKPIYHTFVNNAKTLNPKRLCMIIPARWFVASDNKALERFRDEMLNDPSIKHLVDYPDSKVCFPDVQIEGGVCYFLRDTMHHGPCEVKTIKKDSVTVSIRRLNEHKNFVRHAESLSILNKIKAFKEQTMDACVLNRDPFGFRTHLTDIQEMPFDNAVKVYAYRYIGWVDHINIKANANIIHQYKVLVPKAYNDKQLVIGEPIVAERNSCCTQTYLVALSSENEIEAIHCANYLKTKFARFLISLLKVTQNSTKKVYAHLPMQDFSKAWTDEILYKKYGLTQDEISYIESTIRPID